MKIKQISLNFSVFLICLLLFQTISAQYNFNELSKALETSKKALGGNVVVLIWKDSSIIYKKEMGDFNAKTQAPIAHSSKWLTAALIMTLVDQGKLDLDDPVARYLPIFDKYAKSYLTIRNCLTHTTGLETDNQKLTKLFQRKRFASLEEEVNVLVSREIINNPGKEFHFGDIGTTIAGRVAEVISKKGFDRLIQERLLRPLKMRATSFADDAGGAVNPSTGARSTANDYMNFLSMLLNKGMFEGKRILSEESVEAMHTLHFPKASIKFAPAAANGYSFGLGEWIQTDNSGALMVSTSPALYGTWPMIDHCRGYAAIFFVSTLLNNEQKQDLYMSFKKLIDGQITSGKCQ